MSNSHRDRQNASADDRPDRPDHTADPTGDLPPEPNPEHPRLYRDEAHRVFKQVKAGMRDGSDLSAREYGLIAYHYPHAIQGYGGDPA